MVTSTKPTGGATPISLILTPWRCQRCWLCGECALTGCESCGWVWTAHLEVATVRHRVPAGESDTDRTNTENTVLSPWPAGGAQGMISHVVVDYGS
eukprot:CAMPEP_0175875996 /NCGR_PEP_ID=MMETSP0107_2-20121207/39781_1 /TAXON_ID=195067 ORGANISM="Goniomonas pacifica, Strain CCMP1869" /NCGR_SAMPLE_ID=MMETSP0107_2 /ASSEMBLY_ACC=CAM_ASM_000203 /LENGTH=95 /DNA_ID=CAMNT_0017195109 /DNA_START=220 /DNA_END=507 /DNA_ORIENTATION=-